MFDLQSILDAGVAAKHAPGLAAAVLTRDGHTIVACAGVGDIRHPAPITHDTLFSIASCSKAVTSIAALQLVERGLLSLDEPVGKYLPVLAAPRILTGFDDAGAPSLHSAGKAITLRHLLSHTSGLAYDFCAADLKRYLDATGRTLLGTDDPDIPLLFEPGDGWQYGIGIDWAGRLIEAVTGKSLDIYVAENILEPLGLHHTTYFPDDSARVASVHDKSGDGSFAVSRFALPRTRHFMMGGGGLYSTPGDYLEFLKVVLAGGAPLLRKETFAEALSPETGNFDAGMLRSADPGFSNDYDPLPGSVRRHNLVGLTNLDRIQNGRSARSLTWAGITNCYYWADMTSGVAGVLMAQVLPFADPGILATFDEIERATYRLD